MIKRNGYLMKWVPGRAQPNGTSLSRGRYVYLHRLVMEEHLGRFLESDELVHHRNEDKLDNRLDNLTLVSRPQHAREHIKQGSWGIGKPGPRLDLQVDPRPCAWCGKPFKAQLRVKCCSPSCGQKLRYNPK